MVSRDVYEVVILVLHCAFMLYKPAYCDNNTDCIVFVSRTYKMEDLHLKRSVIRCNDGFIFKIDYPQSRCHFSLTVHEYNNILNAFTANRTHGDIHLVQPTNNDSSPIGGDSDAYGLLSGQENMTKFRFLSFQVDQLVNLFTFQSKYRQDLSDRRNVYQVELSAMEPCLSDGDME